MHKSKSSVLILGAGLAGLTAAWFLKRQGVDVRVLERAPQPGGTLSLGEWSGFYFDAGIHVLHTHDREILDFLQRDLGLALTAVQRRAYFVSRGKLVPYPFQVNAYSLPWADRLRVLLESLRLPFSSPAHYGDFLLKNFGPTLSRHYFIPYARKFWTVDPQELALDWVPSRVPLPRLRDRLQGLFRPVKGDYGPNATFFYPRQGGMAALGNALAASLREQITCNMRVKNIFPLERKVSCEQGDEYHYKVCITTLPLPLAVSMLQPVPAGIRSMAAGLRHTAMLCLNVAIQGKLPHAMHWVYFPCAAEPAARVHFPGNISPATVPTGCAALQLEIPCRGGAADAAAYSPDIEACLQRLEKLGLVTGIKANLLFAQRQIVDPAYVIHDHYRAQYLPDILGYLFALGLIPAGRFGLWGYHWMHESISSGKKAAALALARLGR